MSWSILLTLIALVIMFFIDLTVASTLPLDCGFLGELVLCLIPQSRKKSWNCWDMNWVPWSLQITSGTAVRQNSSRRMSMSFLEVMSLPQKMMVGQSVLQSTMMRKMLPSFSA